MLLHDNIKATDDAMKMFFMEVYELFIKVHACMHDLHYSLLSLECRQWSKTFANITVNSPNFSLCSG